MDERNSLPGWLSRRRWLGFAISTGIFAFLAWRLFDPTSVGFWLMVLGTVASVVQTIRTWVLRNEL